MRERLFWGIDEAAALDELCRLPINYDPALAPEDGRPEGHWHVDSGTTVLGREPPGPPEDGGVFDIACRLVSQYEFADARILRAIYRGGRPLLGRNMLLEGRFCGLRFYFGVRVNAVIDQTRDDGHDRLRVWGWCYQTLQGHLEQGRLSYEVIKDLNSGEVVFRVAGYSRQADIRNPVIRLGFRLFGRRTQERFYQNVQRRMSRLLQAAQRGHPLPTPTIRADGIILAPAGVRPRRLERLARGWLHAGA